MHATRMNNKFKYKQIYMYIHRGNKLRHTQAHKHTSAQAHKHTSTQAHKHTSTQAHSTHEHGLPKFPKFQ